MVSAAYLVGTQSGYVQKMMKFSNDIASSEYDAIANDSLKDNDNGIWLIGLPQSIQAVWFERFYWIRWVDRLAEQDQVVHPGGQQFPAFYKAWKRLLEKGYLVATDRKWPVLEQIEACWFNQGKNSLHQLEIEAWDCYVEAVADYHQPSLTIDTLQDYEEMLSRLAGGCFQCLPFLENHHRAIARGFGVLDQFYNNLRDLYEDARQGVCYFPTELLDRFGVQREEILDMSCFANPGYQQLMTFWVDVYLPKLRQQNLELALQPDLHPAWQCLTSWFLHRYDRLEYVMQTCRYDFVAFAKHYWQLVEQELQQQTAEVEQSLVILAQTPIEDLGLARHWNNSPARPACLLKAPDLMAQPS